MPAATDIVSRMLLVVCRAFLQLVSTIVLIAVGAPFALPALLVMMGVFYALYRYFMASVRQAKRLEAVSRYVDPIHDAAPVVTRLEEPNIFAKADSSHTGYGPPTVCGRLL
jgi:uncharacterized membrane protein